MVLMETAQTETKGNRILKIASSFMYVTIGTPVHDLLAEMKEPFEHAIAVVDPDRKIKGCIIPQDLVEILGKPFGRDLLKRQKVEDIMRSAKTYRYDEYIQEIRNRIGGDLESGNDTHYILVDGQDRFCGHVSSRDILTHAMNESQKELETAITIQSRLVPPCFLARNERISITCSSVMAQGVGGDYYHVLEYTPGKWFFCLCDISGKGISAAIITAVLAGFMYNANFSIPLEETIERLNRIILDTFKLEKYLTGIFGRFSERTGELEYCDMGHAFFFSVDRSTVQQIAESANNVPVGLVDNPKPIARTFRIAPGTVLLILSDGIIEQKNSEGKVFDISNIGTELRRCIEAGDDLVRAKIRILETFFSFKKNIPQHDDISMLIFHYCDEELRPIPDM